MRYDYEITVSSEMDRLQLNFADAEFATLTDMSRVMRVGGRRDAAGVTTHWVFPPSVESEVRAHIAKAEDRIVNGPARHAAWLVKQEAAEAQAAAQAKADAKAKKTAQAQQEAAVVIEIIPGRFGGFVLRMPCNAKGAPELLRAAGASWNRSEWTFDAGRFAGIEALLPKLRKLVVKQEVREEKFAARRDARSGLDVGSRWNMTDSEIIKELGYLPSSESAMERAFGTSDY